MRSFELIRYLVESGLDAGLVDARRAGHPGAADDIVTDPNRQPAGNGDDIWQRYLLADHRIVACKGLGVFGSRCAEAERRVSLAPGVLHGVRAGVVAAQSHDDLAGAINDDC